MNITINFGASNSIRKEFPNGTTIGQVLSDNNMKLALGFGDNVVAKIDGVTQGNDKRLVDGDYIDLEVRANQKAIMEFLSTQEETSNWVLVKAP